MVETMERLPEPVVSAYSPCASISGAPVTSGFDAPYLIVTVTVSPFLVDVNFIVGVPTADCWDPTPIHGPRLSSHQALLFPVSPVGNFTSSTALTREVTDGLEVS